LLPGEIGKRPSLSTVEFYFGSWSKAIQAARLHQHPKLGGRRNPKKCKSGRHAWIPANIISNGNGEVTCGACKKERRFEALG